MEDKIEEDQTRASQLSSAPLDMEYDSSRQQAAGSSIEQSTVLHT